MLVDAGIPVLVRPGGPGAGGWGSVATFAHDLYVRQDDLAELVRSSPGCGSGNLRGVRALTIGNWISPLINFHSYLPPAR